MNEDIKKIITVYSLIALCFLSNFCLTVNAINYNEWNYYKILNFNNGFEGLQVNFNVSYGHGDNGLNFYCKENFEDLRFFDYETDELLYAWNKTTIISSYCDIWLKLGISKNVTMRYGNLNAESYWSLENTFDAVIPNVVMGLTMDAYEGNTVMENGDLEIITFENDTFSDDNGNRSLPWGIEPLAGTEFSSEFDNSIYHSADYSLKFENLTNQYYLYYAPPEWSYKPNCTENLIYSCSAWFKTDSLTGSGVSIRHQFWNITQGYLGGNQKVYTLLGSNDWTKLTFSMTAPENTYKGDAIVVIYGTGTVWVDDIEFNCTGVKDYSGYKNNGLIEGEGNENTTEPNIETGKFNNALVWSSIDRKTFLRVIDDDSLTTPDSFTWGTWIYLTKTSWGSGQEWSTIFSKDYFWNEEWFTIFSNGLVSVRFNSMAYIGSSIHAIASGWNFIIVEWNGTYVNYYINGVFDASSAYSGTITNTIFDLWFSVPVTGYNFEGKIDNTFILNGTITNDEVSILNETYGDFTIVEGFICCRYWGESEVVFSSEYSNSGNDALLIAILAFVIALCALLFIVPNKKK